MRIEDYIKDLLYRYECVVVPGFGAFLAQRKPAQIHETTHAFYPPKKYLSFNAQVTDNDGLLIGYISKSEGIAYQEASQAVHAFVKQLKTALSEIGEIKMDSIGSFQQENDQLVFQPSYHTNYLLDAFGMDMYTFPKVNREQQATLTEVKSAKAKPVTETPVKPLHQQEEVNKTTQKTRTPYWRYAAVGAVAIGLAGFLGASWYSNEVKAYNLAEQQKAEKKIEQHIQQATFAIDAPFPEVTFTVQAQTGKYHIVAGAFRLKENAEKKLTELRDAGFPAREIGANKYGLHQVIYQSFTSRNEAINELRNIKSAHNPNAWLLVKEL